MYDCILYATHNVEETVERVAGIEPTSRFGGLVLPLNYARWWYVCSNEPGSVPAATSNMVPVGCTSKQPARGLWQLLGPYNLQASLVYGHVRQHRYRAKSELFVSS